MPKKRLTAVEERERFIRNFSISKGVFKSNYDPKQENGGRHIIVGLDVSNARTGVCIMSIANSDLIKITSIKPKGKTRYQRIADTIDQLQTIIPTNTLFVTYENYAFGGPRQGMSNMTSIAELGGIVRWHLRNLGLQILHVSPTQLKKWILKKGMGEKDLILKEVYKRYSMDCKNNDEADAVVLADIGRCFAIWTLKNRLRQTDDKYVREFQKKVPKSFKKRNYNIYQYHMEVLDKLVREQGDQLNMLL